MRLVCILSIGETWKHRRRHPSGVYLGDVHTLEGLSDNMPDRIVASNPRKVPANLHPNPDGTGPVIEIASASSRVVSFRRLPSLGVMRWILVPLFIFLVGIDIGDGIHAHAVSMTMHDFWTTQIGLNLFIGIQAVAALLIRPPDVVIIVREAKKRRRITAWLSRTQQS